MKSINMTVGPGTYAHRYIPKRNALKSGPAQSSSNSGNPSSSSASTSGHPYKRTQPSSSASTDPPGNIGPNVSNSTKIGQMAPVLVPARRPHAVVQGAQNPGALGPPNPRAEKRRFIQQHLVLILHAFQCRRKQLHEFCQLPHCATFREVLGHMSTCQQDLACHFPHCTSSKQIYRHWKTCHRADCSICVPIRLADRLERNHY
ncbi:histone lysine acetyltransferase CREBBP isoform X1 [Frankliniella occidentalis]|uniref:histone acetyltransferase n=2 Tax=Frankliniella occidentalis TaxID=133901 RepID=A0A6J1SXF0_FRAOC|nr:histone lysine acetyltransferase CREBBP isoform X1 [Frankliniella occidentalis]